MRVLVTGANGFVGRALCGALRQRGHAVIGSVRGPDSGPLREGVARVEVGEVCEDTRWDAALEGIEAIVHLVARTHVMREHAPDAEAAFRTVNVGGTARLARQAVERGIERLVFLSSIKVNGERSGARPFSPDDVPAPEDAYGRTKRDAEVALHAAVRGSATRVTVLRSPLVYGPGVKGNFLRLIQAIDGGWPLPLALVRNRRSLVYVDNLCGALSACLDAPAIGGETYLVSDGPALSTPDLVQRLARALGRRARLLPAPPLLLRGAGALLGQGGAVRRLTDSLELDDSKLRAGLGWSPPVAVDEGLARTARWYATRP